MGSCPPGNGGGDDDVKVVMLKAGQLPSSVSNLLHWEIALFTGGPSTQLSGGGVHTHCIEKYAEQMIKMFLRMHREGILL